MTTARCNPLWQPIPCPLSDIEGLESWLGDMAAQGLVPVTIGQNFARFRCSQPKAVRYRLNAKPAPETFLESAPGTPDGEERALAQECGWYYVTAVGDFFLYACEDSDAPELNTDPQVQALSLRYAKRQVFAPAGLLAYWLVTFWVRYAMGVWHTPVIDFVELGWLSFCYLGLLAAALVSVVHNTVLLYRFSARLTRGAEPERHKNWRKGAGRYLVGRMLAALLFVLTVVFLYPLWYVLVGSISDPVRLFMHNGLLWRPLGFSLQGYRTMLQNPNVGIGYANTIFYVVVGTVLSIFFSCLGAYTLSRPKLMFKKLFTLLVVFTMYFSGGMIPKFLVVKGVGLYNTRMAVILPGVISTWNMIVMRTSFRAIPQSLEESARLDGAGDFTILFRIIVPCAKATIAVMVLYYAVAQWNGWFDAMIYLQDRSKFPLQLFLREILLININNANNAAGNDAADVLYLDTLVKYAMIIISTVPILCIYPFVQKYFMKGVMMGSIKE